MVQAARSGVQNIAEGSLASGTSKKTELKLTGVARANLGELIRDYEDFLRQAGLPVWDKESPRVRAMRARLAGKLKKAPGTCQSRSERSDRSDRSEFFDEPLLSALRVLKSAPAELSANILLCLAHQASYLLKCQMQRLEKDFPGKRRLHRETVPLPQRAPRRCRNKAACRPTRPTRPTRRLSGLPQ